MGSFNLTNELPVFKDTNLFDLISRVTQVQSQGVRVPLPVSSLTIDQSSIISYERSSLTVSRSSTTQHGF
jgi:hypothetical protein